VVGREHARKIVTVLLEEHVAQILDGERFLRQILIDRQLLRE